MRLTYQELVLPLARPFRIAHGESRQRVNLLVRLDQGEHRGLGEAALVPYRADGDRERAGRFLDRVAPHLVELEPFALQELARLFTRLDPQAAHRNLQAALETAVQDLRGRILGVPLWRLWGLAGQIPEPTSLTIPMAPPDEAAAIALAAAEMPVLKLKVGSPADLAAVEAVRRARPDATLRVDANRSLTPEAALAMARALEGMGGVDLLEEPLVDPTPERLGRIQERTGLPIFADESVQGPADIVALAGRVAGVNLKLAKLGGLEPLHEALTLARNLGLQVMLGCMVESSLAVTACAHLASLADALDLDGPLLLADDPFQGVSITGGRLFLPTAPGLGVEPRRP